MVQQLLDHPNRTVDLVKVPALNLIGRRLRRRCRNVVRNLHDIGHLEVDLRGHLLEDILLVRHLPDHLDLLDHFDVLLDRHVADLLHVLDDLVRHLDLVDDDLLDRDFLDHLDGTLDDHFLRYGDVLDHLDGSLHLDVLVNGDLLDDRFRNMLDDRVTLDEIELDDRNRNLLDRWHRDNDGEFGGLGDCHRQGAENNELDGGVGLEWNKLYEKFVCLPLS